MRMGTSLLMMVLMLIACQDDSPEITTDYRQEMRSFVQEISQYAGVIHPGFIIIPQNGVELVSSSGEENGSPVMEYLTAITGIGQESLLYGYAADDQATPLEARNWTQSFLDLAHDSAGVVIMVIDYCYTPNRMSESYTWNSNQDYISFAADHRELDNIPFYPTSIWNENDAVVSSLADVANFLYLINPQQFSSRQDLVEAIAATNYDLIIMDYFFNDEAYDAGQIEQLRQKANGGERLLVAYMSIGEAEEYRYYWQSEWDDNYPTWLADENPNWPGNYRVEYWQEEWQAIIFGSDSAYLDRVLATGFDGVYLDIIDAFEFFEGVE